MKDLEMLKVLQDHGFIGADLPMISKLKKPEVYGIQLTDEARRCLAIAAKPRKGTQTERIVEYCKRMGSITSYEASNFLNIMSFTKRMSEIRRNPNYEVSQKSESDGHTTWMRYEIHERETEADAPNAEVQNH
jgi:hypothetical protein